MAKTWVCAYCQKRNDSRYVNCRSCNALNEEEEKKPEITPEVAPKVTDSERIRPSATRRSAPPPAFVEATRVKPSAPPRRSSFGTRLVITIVIGLVIWFVWNSGPQEKPLRVESMDWSTKTVVQVRMLRTGDGWDGDKPSGAVNASCQLKFRKSVQCNPKKCNPHDSAPYACKPHKCNPHPGFMKCEPYQCRCQKANCKNGQSKCGDVCDTCYKQCPTTLYDECHETCIDKLWSICYDQCPVNDRWCHYSYSEWPVMESANESGKGSDVKWPKTNLDVSANNRVERSGSFTVRFTDGKDHWVYTAKNVSDFQRFRINDSWIVKVGSDVAEPLHPAK